MKYRAAKWLAWQLPELVVYWCYLRVAAHATSGKWSSTPVPNLSMMDALDRWGKPNDLASEQNAAVQHVSSTPTE